MWSSCGIFLFWICFFYAEVRMFNRLGKTCVFFPHFLWSSTTRLRWGFMRATCWGSNSCIGSWQLVILSFSFLFFFYFQFNRQSRNKIMSLYTDSMSAQIGITTMFAILVAADLVGNTIVCLIIIVFHDMR